MAEFDAGRIRANLEQVRERIGPDVEICAAIKYVPADQLPALAEAGIELVGENRAQDLLAKQERHRESFSWDFIGALQSRKLRDIAPNVRLIHSVASDSALGRLEQHPAREVLIQVNVAGEEGKAGIAPEELGAFVDRCPVPVGGLMTMPPFVERAEDNRRWFARLAELAAEHGLERLSMGTTQDYEVAEAPEQSIGPEGPTQISGGPILSAPRSAVRFVVAEVRSDQRFARRTQSKLRDQVAELDVLLDALGCHRVLRPRRRYQDLLREEHVEPLAQGDERHLLRDEADHRVRGHRPPKQLRHRQRLVRAAAVASPSRLDARATELTADSAVPQGTLWHRSAPLSERRLGG